MKNTLLKSALGVINKFENLNVAGHVFDCPYFDNERVRLRAALAVMIGKGTPKDIEEEANLLATKEKIDLKSMSLEDVKKFLVDHRIGIDCSGFVYQVLDAEVKEKHGKSLKSVLSFPFAKNPLRKLLAKMRPIENTNVKSLAHERNSVEVDISDIKPGDMIVRFSDGAKKDVDHVLIITEVDENILKYSHSSEWPADGRINHGIKRGKIKITDPKKSIVEQSWEEAGKIGDNNMTHVRMMRAREVMVRRLNLL